MGTGGRQPEVNHFSAVVRALKEVEPIVQGLQQIISTLGEAWWFGLVFMHQVRTMVFYMKGFMRVAL